jgi:hypothetical protein
MVKMQPGFSLGGLDFGFAHDGSLIGCAAAAYRGLSVRFKVRT